jgi:hypothetical protein
VLNEDDDLVYRVKVVGHRMTRNSGESSSDAVLRFRRHGSTSIHIIFYRSYSEHRVEWGREQEQEQGQLSRRSGNCHFHFTRITWDISQGALAGQDQEQELQLIPDGTCVASSLGQTRDAGKTHAPLAVRSSGDVERDAGHYRLTLGL